MKENQTNRYDLTQGSIIRKLLVIALPIMGTQLLQMAYSLMDVFWLGRLSGNSVAAAGTAGMYAWLSMAFIMIGRIGAEIGVSQHLGRKDRQLARRFSENALFLAVVLGILFSLFVMLLRYPLIRVLGVQEQEVIQEAAAYLLIIGIGMPATFITGTMNGIFNGAGNSKLPFYINAIGLCFNMLLDPLLIFGLNMGIEGAALATIAAQILVMLLFLVAIKRSREKPFEQYHFRNIGRPDRKAIRQICRWSVPVGVESLCFTGLSMVISRMVAAYGADAIAAQKIGSQIESLSWLICGGFSTALTAFIGQNYGAGRWNRVTKGYRVAALLMTGWCIFVSIVFIAGGRPLTGIFIAEAHIIDYGAAYLRTLGYVQVLAGMEAFTAGTLRGIGKTMPPSVISIFSNVVRIPIAYMLTGTSLGIDGIWWGIAIGVVLRGVLLVIWYIPVERKIGRTFQSSGL